MISLFKKETKKKKPKVKKTVKKRVVKKKAVRKKVTKKPTKKSIKKVVKKKVIKRTVKKKATKKKTSKKTAKAPEILKMDEAKAYDKVRTARIPVVPYMFIKKETDVKAAMKKTGIPCVMKVAGKSIIHKTEKNGIFMNIDSEERGIEAFNKLMKIKEADSVIVQKQLEGLELIIGAKKSGEFGYVVSVGLGGIYVEVLKDITFRIAPLTTYDAETMVKELKGYNILKGVRDQKGINLNKLHEVLVKTSKFVINNKIKEMDINPLICNEEGCLAVDIRIIE
jgi:acetyltransferase